MKKKVAKTINNILTSIFIPVFLYNIFGILKGFKKLLANKKYCKFKHNLKMNWLYGYQNIKYD